MDDMQTINWADRGQNLTIDLQSDITRGCIGVSRMSSVQVGSGAFTLWLQVRGCSRMESSEGRFHLHAGHWIVLDRNSQPRLQADRRGLCIGVALQGNALELLNADACRLYPGCGAMTRCDLQIAIRLWRQLVRRPAHDRVSGDAMLRALLRHVVHLQRSMGLQEDRCPGRSLHRRRHVLGRLCRAHLTLQGNVDRVVSIGELAELSSLSYWYFSKAYQGVFGESPQAAGVRLRMERAAELLLHSDLIVGEVGAACGFESGCSFARAFRAHFGVTASAYRCQMRALRTKAQVAHIHRASRTG